MLGNTLSNDILRTIEQTGTPSVRDIMETLSMDYRDARQREKIHSLLYGELKPFVIRDKNEEGMPTWRIKGEEFEAAKGLELLFYTQLCNKGILDNYEASLDTKIENRRKRKIYYLDIALSNDERKIDIEVDGYEHIRADALLSMQQQIAAKGTDCSIEIDWMDNASSYVDYKSIDRKIVYTWCSTHPDWCIRYHEELLWPHDITRNMWLIENGWKIIRFWNFEIKNDCGRCMQDVAALL